MTVFVILILWIIGNYTINVRQAKAYKNENV